MSGRQWLGIGDVEAGAADDLLAQGVDEVIGDDVPAPGDVDEPGVGLHQGQLVGGDQPLGLGGEGQGDDDEVRPRQRIGIAVGVEDVVDTREILGATADDGDVAVERLQAGAPTTW